MSVVLAINSSKYAGSDINEAERRETSPVGAIIVSDAMASGGSLGSDCLSTGQARDSKEVEVFLVYGSIQTELRVDKKEFSQSLNYEIQLQKCTTYREAFIVGVFGLLEKVSLGRMRS